VLLAQVVAALEPRDGAIYVDGTFGAGGHAKALLEAADCTVWGIDRDPDAVAGAAEMLRRFAGRLHVLRGRFGSMRELLGDHGVRGADGIALDLGVSSPQFDRPERGFSFRADGPLDMRMDKTGPSAADLVNGLSERELALTIRGLGEERKARAIARAIVAARARAPILRTLQLADIVRRVVPSRRRDAIDPATRTFQALRMRVNDELGELERGLDAAEALLKPGGRLAVVSFHSLEDRRVKAFPRERSGALPRPSRHRPADDAEMTRAATFRLLTRDAVRPSTAEAARNPRARSARLRAAERLPAPSWSAAA